MLVNECLANSDGSDPRTSSAGPTTSERRLPAVGSEIDDDVVVPLGACGVDHRPVVIKGLRVGFGGGDVIVDHAAAEALVEVGFTN